MVYILSNSEIFKEAKEFFSINFNENVVIQLNAVCKILKPIIDFTNAVQKHFDSIASIDNSNDFGFAKIVQESLEQRFSHTCDYVIAELGFLFTRNGRDWWQMMSKQADSITFKLIQLTEVTDAENKFIQIYNLEKSLLL